MSKENNGGAAFPSPTGNLAQDGGLTVRDWFAGQALAGILPAGDKHGGGCAFTETEPEWIAEKAYAQADAMMARRQNTDSANVRKITGVNR